MRATNSRSWLCGLTAMALLLAISPVQAAPGGGAPQVGSAIANLRPGDGAVIDMASLRGRIVLIDFWASWCGPCMAEAPHMVKLNTDFGPKGLTIIGISLDRDQAAMNQAIQAKGLSWTQHMDTNGPLSAAWGVTGIPRCFLIGPDGILLWIGHPAQIDAPLADAFEKHPPKLVDDKTLAEATKAADAIEAAVKSGDSKQAVQLLGRFPSAALQDGALATRIQATQTALNKSADDGLAEVDALIAEKKYVEAVPKLKDISRAFAMQPPGVKARLKLQTLAAIPEAKKQIELAEKADRGAEALAAAMKLKEAHKDEQAYAKFKEIASAFAGTPAGDSAAGEVKTYEQDAAFVKKVTTGAAETKVKAAMALAESYKNAGRSDLARKKYQDVIDQFPGTPFADEARKAQSALGPQ